MFFDSGIFWQILYNKFSRKKKKKYRYLPPQKYLSWERANRNNFKCGLLLPNLLWITMLTLIWHCVLLCLTLNYTVWLRLSVWIPSINSLEKIKLASYTSLSLNQSCKTTKVFSFQSWCLSGLLVWLAQPSRVSALQAGGCGFKSSIEYSVPKSL